MEKELLSIAKQLSGIYGEAFFNKICLLFNRTFSADYTFIALLDDACQQATTLALVHDEQIVENFSYALKGTPCSDVINSSRCIIPKQVSSLYPQDELLAEMKIEAYVGLPLLDSRQKVIGIVVALFCREINDSGKISMVLELFSGRIAGEFERVVKERELLQLNKSLDKQVNIRTQELEKTIEKLQQAQKTIILNEKMASLGLLTASIAHEIANPAGYAHTALFMAKEEIKKIKNFLFSLAGGTDADPQIINTINAQFSKLNGLITTASDGSQRIKTTLNDLRLFTREDGHKKQDVKLSELIKSTVFLVSTQFDHIQINQIPKHDPFICCYPARLSQVFMNIVSNACQAIEEKLQKQIFSPVINITTQLNEDSVEVIIEDNGCGMSPSVQKRLFEPFFTTKEAQGTGLGMSISQDIMTEHGGQIKVESQENLGTKIVLILPLKS